MELAAQALRPAGVPPRRPVLEDLQREMKDAVREAMETLPKNISTAVIGDIRRLYQTIELAKTKGSLENIACSICKEAKRIGVAAGRQGSMDGVQTSDFLRRFHSMAVGLGIGDRSVSILF